MTTTPTVLFICHHNAGRSQLGASLLAHLAGDKFTATSAGISPANEVSPETIAALDEIGAPTTGLQPRAVTPHDLRTADIVITMKPRLALPASPSGIWLQWEFPNPEGWSLDGVRVLRDQIAERIRQELVER